MLSPHLSWDNDQLYIPHTARYHVDLCSDQSNQAAVPQFHSIFSASMSPFPHSTRYSRLADQQLCNFCIAGDTFGHCIVVEGTCES
jgi:hypothetical protein